MVGRNRPETGGQERPNYRANSMLNRRSTLGT